jgi:N-acetylneuraminic acid mutarotase
MIDHIAAIQTQSQYSTQYTTIEMLSCTVQTMIVSALLADLGVASAIPPRTPTNSHGKTHWIRHDSIGLGPRQEHGVAGFHDQIFVVGGVRYDNNNTVETVNLVEYYSIEEQKWHVAAPLPQAVNHANAAAVDGKVYVLGSLTAGVNWTALPDTYVYTSGNDSWTALAPMPNGTARGASAIGVYDDTVYLAGGQLFLEIVPPYEQPGLDLVSSYNTTSNTWNTALPNLPQARQHVSGTVVSSTFYVIGGREFDIHSFHNTTFALDLNNPTEWREMAQMPTARGSLACAALGTVIYCFGGEGDASNAYEIFGQVEAYDTMTDTWSSLPPMEVPRHGTGAVALAGNIWIPGGGVKTAMAPVGIVDSFEVV